MIQWFDDSRKEPSHVTFLSIRCPWAAIQPHLSPDRGRNTKLHAISDMKCRPLALYITPGQRADIKGAVVLAGSLPPAQYLLADKAYDAGHFRGFLMNNKIEPVIPSTAARKAIIPHDEKRYEHRNVVERMFGRIKDWHRITTRYDKNAENFFSAICIAVLLCFWV